MQKSRIFAAVCACLLSMTVPPVVASVVYQYTGNQFDDFSSPSSYDASMAVTGRIELADALAADLNSVSLDPLSFSFTDGVNTINDVNATGYQQFIITTDGTGTITAWGIVLALNSAYNQVGDTLRYIDSHSGHNGALDGGMIWTCTNAADCEEEGNAFHDYGTNYNNAGSWGVVPVPGALWLFGSGLLGLFGMARKKFKPGISRIKGAA